MIRKDSQAGAALLSILLIVATLSVAAVVATRAIATQTTIQKLSSRRTLANWAARSAEAAALASVSDLINGSRLPAMGDNDGRSQAFALPVAGGQVILELREQAPCLNLNTLASGDPETQRRSTAAFKTLFQDLGIPERDAARLIAVIADWIDADEIERLDGAESSYYLSQPLGFRAANQLMQSFSELDALPGFTRELREAMSEFTCILPGTEAAPINLNALTTESAPVLRAATQGALSMAEARRFIESRPATGWASLQDVRKYATGQPDLENALSGLPLAVQGRYFIGEGDARFDAGDWSFQFILSADSASSPVIVWRAFGGVS